MPDQVADLNVLFNVPLPAPALLMHERPRSDGHAATVFAARRRIEDILHGRSERFLVIVGPCSIHDPSQGIAYAKELAVLRDELHDQLEIVMRVYFEKPRTTVGWKGLINDPHLDDSFDVATGLRLARELLIEIARLGLPTATEFLEPITPQYIADTIVLGAIGARTTESPTHRQMASGLSMPVGFKNSTDGSLQAAIDAMIAAKAPHSFLGIDDSGGIAVVSTTGNPWGMLMLRGGRSGSNYSPEVMAEARTLMEKAGLQPRIVVDCSHANSGKDPARQALVWRDVLAQRAAGDRSIVGMMLESNIHAGNQAVQADRSKLAYGVSVTDACIGWEETEELLLEAHARLA
jgi:3-deoxy-7-phosphoheptulonate synthase